MAEGDDVLFIATAGGNGSDRGDSSARKSTWFSWRMMVDDGAVP